MTTCSLRHARLQAERDAVAATIPPDPGSELARIERQLAGLRRDRTDLLTCQGRYAGTAEGDAARRYLEARENLRDAERHAEGVGTWWDRRQWRKEAVYWVEEESSAEAAYVAAIGPEANRLDQAVNRIEERRDEVELACQERSAWLADHPEAIRRLRSLDQELHPVLELPEIQALGRHHVARPRHVAGIRRPGPDHGIELDFGP